MNEKLSRGTRLQLDVKRTEELKIKRQRTLTSPFKSTQQSPEITVPPVEIVVPPGLMRIASISITFNDEQGRPSTRTLLWGEGETMYGVTFWLRILCR